MNFNFLHLRSLKTRMTLFMLAIFLIGIWSLAFYTRHMLREDMQQMLSYQQFSTVSLLAAKVNQELDERLRALEKIAGGISPDILDNSAALQTFLEQRILLQSLFNGGTFITGVDGTATGSIPLSAERIGSSYMDRDYVATALKEGKSTISQPVMGRALHSPIFAIAVPIRDSGTKVIGALAGVTDLGKPNFLDSISQGRYGKTGGYVLIEPQSKMIITATDKTRIMTPLPATGINPMLDRYMQGYEGSGIIVDSRGLEVLSSAKRIPVSGWFLVARVPTEEAFSPIRAMQRRMLLIAICMSLLVCALTWWMLRRLLSPILTAVTILAVQSNTEQPPQPLPITSHDEIGELIGGFNHLLETLKQRNEALRRANKYKASILESISDAFFSLDNEMIVTYFNRAAETTLGKRQEEVVGHRLFDVFTEARGSIFEEYYSRAIREKIALDFETYFGIAPYENWYNVHVYPHEDGIAVYFQVITERKRVEEELLHLNETLEHRVAIEVEKNLRHERLLIQQNRLAAMGEMIGNIAHQWRQPLNSLGLLIFNIKDAYQFNKLDAAYLDQAVADGRRMVQKMSTTISDFSNFFRPNKEIIVFSALEQIREAIALVESSFQQSNISIHIDASKDIKLMGFPNEYSQVLLNLLSNAKDAILSHNQKLSGRVDIILTEQDGQGCVSVRDNGGGIPDEILDRIFDPYFSTKGKGSGIGLYMSKMIIERNMNGSITANNIEGGAEFSVCAPFTKDGPHEPS